MSIFNSTKLENTLSAALTVAALVMAAGIAKREFFSSAPRREPEMEYEPHWRNALSASRAIGDPGAKVMIISFSDFECPFCARLHQSVREIQRRFPGQVGYSFIHFPLAGHPQAVPAVIAAECAFELGGFTQAVDSLFSEQAQLGRKPWLDFVSPRSNADSARAQVCLRRDPASLQMLTRGKSLGDAFHVTGTPAVFLNGWRFRGMPADSELARAVQDILAGKKPYPGFPQQALNLSK